MRNNIISWSWFFFYFCYLATKWKSGRDCKFNKIAAGFLFAITTCVFAFDLIKPGGLDVETNRDRDRDRP